MLTIVPSRAWIRAALVLGCLCLGACKASETFNPPLSPVLVGAPPLDITLSNEVRRLYERDYRGPGKTTFLIGRLLQRLFPARDGAAFLSNVHSDLEIEWVSEQQGWEAHYETRMNLQVRGSIHEVSAQATCSNSQDPDLAGRQAIEASVESLYAQAAALLRRPGR